MTTTQTVSKGRLADITEVIGAIVKAGDCRLYDAESKVPLMFKADTLLSILTELISLRNAQSEAVAWRWRLTDSETWHTEKVDPSGRIGGAHIVVEPLYTHPAPQSEAVAVKALSDLDLLYVEMTRRMDQPKYLDQEGGTNPDWLPVDDTQVGVEFAFEFLSALTHPAPPLAVTDEMVKRAVRAMFGEAARLSTPEPSGAVKGASYHDLARAALTAALEAKQ